MPNIPYGIDLISEVLNVVEKSPVNGPFAEYGVADGRTLQYIADRTSETVHGFDSFEGLPEAFVTYGAGAFSRRGDLPDVPANAVLHKGWFEDTLPGFLADNAEPFAFVHLDCDLYSSAKTVFDLGCDRFVPGTVMIMDDYHSHPEWRGHIHKAFREFVESRGKKFRWLAHSDFAMAVQFS